MQISLYELVVNTPFATSGDLVNTAEERLGSFLIRAVGLPDKLSLQLM